MNKFIGNSARFPHLLDNKEDERIEASDAKDKLAEEENELAAWLFTSISMNDIKKAIESRAFGCEVSKKSIENAFEQNVDFQCKLSEFLFDMSHVLASEEMKLRNK